MRGVWRVAGRAAIAGWWLLVLGTPAEAIRVQGTSVTLEWAPASGAVQDYLVWLSIDAGPFFAHSVTREPRATISGQAGEALRVRVAARGTQGGRPVTGPVSDPSDILLLQGSAPEPPEPPPPAPPPTPPPPEPPPSQPPPSPPGDPLDGMTLDTVQPGPDWRFAGTGDFDGNGRPDLLSRDIQTGQVLVWLLDDALIVGGGHLGWTDPDDQLHVGDFDGDGTSDVLIQGARSGVPTIWFVSQAAVRQLRNVWDRALRPDLRLAVGDFNADGRDDFFVLDPQSGATEQVLLKGAQVLARVSLPSLSSAGSRIPLPGDFDGDGLGDVALYNRGQQEVWLSNASGPPTRKSLNSLTGIYRPSSGDHDGDGRTDLLYQRPSTGTLTLWTLDGSVRLTESVLGNVPGSHRVHGVDLNDDGKDDLLVHSPNEPNLRTLIVP